MPRRIYILVPVFLLILLTLISTQAFSQTIELVELSRCLESGNYTTLVVQDNYAFASTSYGFKILDVSDQLNPLEVVNFPTDGITVSLSVEGDFLFVCDALSGLLVYDITDIGNPVMTDVMNPPGVIRSVCPYGNYLYMAAENYGLQIIDYSNPYNLELVNIVYIGGEINKIAIMDNYLYVTQGIAGLGVYDITNPEVPVYELNWNTIGGNAKGLYIFPDGEHLAFADYQTEHTCSI